MVIGIDVDGVILDYVNVVRAYAELYDFDVLNKQGVINNAGTKIEDRYDWTEEEFKNFADSHFYQLTTLSPFNPLAVEIIKRLHDEGHALYVITNRGLLSIEATKNCKEMFDKVNLAIDKYFWGIKDKVSVMKEHNVDILIDDSYNNCMACVDNGLKAIYFREKDAPKIDSPLAYDVDNWGQVYRVIRNLSK